MRGRKTLTAAGSLAGLLVGGAIDPQAAVPTATAVGLVVWVLTSKPKRPTVPRVPRDVETWVAPGAHGPPPSPVPVQRSSWVPSEPPDDAVQAELEHLQYAKELLTAAEVRELIDGESAERLRALIEERRQHALRAALAKAAAPSTTPSKVTASPLPARPLAVPPHMPLAAAPPRPAVPTLPPRPSPV